MAVNPEEAEKFIVEEGEVRWFCRPHHGVDPARIASENDVARFYFVLSPTSHAGKHRLMETAKPRMPEARTPGQERTSGIVVKTGDSMQEVMQVLQKDPTLDTPLVTAGAGLYAIAGKGLKETYLFHDTTQPDQPGDLETLLCIHKYGTFKLAVKNPTVTPSRSVGPHPPPERLLKDAQLMKVFEDKRWAAVHDPRLLEFNGMEFQLLPLKRKVPEHMKMAVIAHLDEMREGAGPAVPHEHEEHEEGRTSPKSRLNRWFLP